MDWLQAHKWSNWNDSRDHRDRYLPNVTLTNQDTSMMNGLGQSKFEHLCLQATLQEIFNFQTQHVIEFHVLLIQHTDTNQTTQQSVTCVHKINKNEYNKINQQIEFEFFNTSGI